MGKSHQESGPGKEMGGTRTGQRTVRPRNRFDSSPPTQWGLLREDCSIAELGLEMPGRLDQHGAQTLAQPPWEEHGPRPGLERGPEAPTVKMELSRALRASMPSKSVPELSGLLTLLPEESPSQNHQLIALLTTGQLVLFSFFFFIAGDRTKAFRHARQGLYH